MAARVAAVGDVQLVHRGKFNSLDGQKRRWLKRRKAIEPAIAHKTNLDWLRCRAASTLLAAIG